jgi:methionyl-tRNA synthetase
LAGSDKLLCSTVNLGPETRTVLSGIAEYYNPADLIGKRVILVANLKPRKIRGVMSHGMLLAAEDPDGRVRLATVDGDLAPGSPVN